MLLCELGSASASFKGRMTLTSQGSEMFGTTGDVGAFICVCVCTCVFLRT